MPSGRRRPSLTRIFKSDPSGFADNTWPALRLRKNKRPELAFATEFEDFDFVPVVDIEFTYSFLKLIECDREAWFRRAIGTRSGRLRPCRQSGSAFGTFLRRCRALRRRQRSVLRCSQRQRHSRLTTLGPRRPPRGTWPCRTPSKALRARRTFFLR